MPMLLDVGEHGIPVEQHLPIHADDAGAEPLGGITSPFAEMRGSEW
jgi:hypothetical protein